MDLKYDKPTWKVTCTFEGKVRRIFPFGNQNLPRALLPSFQNTYPHKQTLPPKKEHTLCHVYSAKVHALPPYPLYPSVQ